jgi:hypothetical protein
MCKLSRRYRIANAFLLAVYIVIPSAAATAAQKGSGPTQAQIDCQNRAVNDYWDNMKSCEQNLSDLPDQLALCQSDARADLDRAKAGCVASRVGGIRVPGTILQNAPQLQIAPE